MNERQLESILRDGPPDEPSYRGDIAARLSEEANADQTGGRVIALVPVSSQEPPRRGRWLIPAAAACVVALLVAGLVLTIDDNEQSVTTPVIRDPALLVDRWVGAPRTDGASAAFVDFRGAGQFLYVSGSATEPGAWGSTWSFSDDGLLTLVLISEERGCPAGAVGRYRWTGPPEASALSLSVVDDECAPRAEQIAGTWTHTACPVGGSDCLGPVDAGTYRSVAFDPEGTNDYGQLAYTLPSGWAVTADSRGQLSLRPTDPDIGVGIDVWADVAVAAARCDGAPDPDSVGASAIAGALAAREGLSVARSQTTVDEREGEVVDGAVADDWSEVCPDEGDAPFVPLLASRTGVPVAWTTGVSAGEPVRLTLIDAADGRTMAIVLRGDGDDEAVEIVESFEFSDVAESS